MSQQKIEGIPEGWEQVRFDIVYPGEYRVMATGEIRQWEHSCPSTGRALVVRKIEKPTQYRPFTALEFLEHSRKPFREKGKMHWIYANGFDKNQIWYADSDWDLSAISWDEAYNEFEFCDGSPFGVEVTT